MFSTKGSILSLQKKLIDRLPQVDTRPRGKEGDLSPRLSSVPAKEWVGRVAGMQHYLKMHDSLKAAHTNYQVSISPGAEDRFLSLLAAVHGCLAAVLEVALAEEVGRMVEEIVKYVTVTIQVDAPGALLCLQQVNLAPVMGNTRCVMITLFSHRCSMPCLG